MHMRTLGNTATKKLIYALAVTVEPQATIDVSKEIAYLQGGQIDYEAIIDVDLSSTNGLVRHYT